MEEQKTWLHPIEHKRHMSAPVRGMFTKINTSEQLKHRNLTCQAKVKNHTDPSSPWKGVTLPPFWCLLLAGACRRSFEVHNSCISDQTWLAKNWNWTLCIIVSDRVSTLRHQYGTQTKTQRFLMQCNRDSLRFWNWRQERTWKYKKRTDS